MSALTASEVAREFRRVNPRQFGSAQKLVDAIDAFMASCLPGSKISSLDVADWVLISQRQSAQLPTPEEAAFQHQVAEGIGDTGNLDELMLAHRVNQMSMNEFGAQRENLGVTQSLDAFLGRN